MDETIEPIVVGVRFSKVGKIYNFVADTVADIKIGDQVVVETSRGWQLGQVAQVVSGPEAQVDGIKSIDRRATPRDLLLRQMWQMKESEVVNSCRGRAADLKLAGIKIVSAEYSFDGSRLTIQFSSETEEKYDLKSLRSDMQKQFAPSQVEMRQIGPRDVAKTMCGMGACGLETRCCCLFLTEFSSISIRMAKEQGISLTPTEITGMCGRLRCCLIYEYDNYVDARSKLPKRNKRVRTPQGDGKVVDVIPLRGSVLVDLPEVGTREFPGADVTILDENAPLPPFQGTRQPSGMDQAITGQRDEVPFTIAPEGSSDQPDESAAADPAARLERPRTPVRGERGRPGEHERTADQEPPADQARSERRERQGGRRQQTGRSQQPGQAGQPGSKGQRDQGSKGPRPGGRNQGDRPARGPRREDRPGPRGGGAQQPGDAQKPGGGGQPGGQPNKPRPESGSSGASGGGSGPNSGRENRRKGRRRDSTDNEA